MRLQSGPPSSLKRRIRYQSEETRQKPSSIKNISQARRVDEDAELFQVEKKKKTEMQMGCSESCVKSISQSRPSTQDLSSDGISFSSDVAEITRLREELASLRASQLHHEKLSLDLAQARSRAAVVEIAKAFLERRLATTLKELSEARVEVTRVKAEAEFKVSKAYSEAQAMIEEMIACVSHSSHTEVGALQMEEASASEASEADQGSPKGSSFPLNEAAGGAV